MKTFVLKKVMKLLLLRKFSLQKSVGNMVAHKKDFCFWKEQIAMCVLSSMIRF